MKFAYLFLGAVVLSFGSLGAQSFSKIVAFGDSWSDAGNANYVSNGGALPLLAAPYSNSRFTNGFLWVDYLADQLGIQRAASNKATGGGTNFAFGGAYLDDGSHASGPWTVTDVGAQVSTYLSGNSASGSELFTFFGGGNDIASGDTVVNDEIGCLTGYVNSVYSAGGRNFLIANMPDLARAPGTFGNGSISATATSFNSQLDAQMNVLRLAHPDANFYMADFYGVMEAVYADPGRYGFEPNLKTHSYSGDFNFLANLLFGEQRANIGDYMWIDGIHPTDKLHQLFGSAAFDALSVPEPSAFLFGTISAIGFFAFGRRRVHE